MTNKRTIPYFNIFASDFKVFKDKMTPQELINLLDGISDICLFGFTDYLPTTNFQEKLFKKLKESLKKSSKSYNASVKNGSKGGRPRKNPQVISGLTKKEPSQEPKTNLDETKRKEKKRKEINLNNLSLLTESKFKIPNFAEIKKYERERRVFVKCEEFETINALNGWKKANELGSWKKLFDLFAKKPKNQRPMSEEEKEDYKKKRDEAFLEQEITRCFEQEVGRIEWKRKKKLTDEERKELRKKIAHSFKKTH